MNCKRLEGIQTLQPSYSQPPKQAEFKWDRQGSVPGLSRAWNILKNYSQSIPLSEQRKECCFSEAVRALQEGCCAYRASWGGDHFIVQHGDKLYHINPYKFDDVCRESFYPYVPEPEDVNAADWVVMRNFW